VARKLVRTSLSSPLRAFAVVVVPLAMLGCRPPSPRAPETEILTNAVERLRSGDLDVPIIHSQQEASLGSAFYRDYERGLDPVPLAEGEELARFRELRAAVDSVALDYLDAFYGDHDENAPWLRSVKLAKPDDPSVGEALKLHHQILGNIHNGYDEQSKHGQHLAGEQLASARQSMLDLETLADQLARQGTGVPFF